MIIKILIAAIFSVAPLSAIAQKNIDPTGTYYYLGKTYQKNGETYGYSGEIQVKKITEKKILMTFEINKGAPSYNSGSFFDTLLYENNKAIHTTNYDSTCKVIFNFTKKGVKVKEETANYNWGCGFGHAVIADGYFRKKSSKIPKLTMPLTGEEIK